MFFTANGDAELVIDNDPYNLAYNFASVEEESPLEEGTSLLGGDSYISAMVIWVEEQVADPQFKCGLEGQCVHLLKERGFNIKGNAWDLKKNTDDPCRGCAILLKRHVGIVLDYTSEYVEFEEKNFFGCGVYSRRRLPVDNNSIRGYIIP